MSAEFVEAIPRQWNSRCPTNTEYSNPWPSGSVMDAKPLRPDCMRSTPGPSAFGKVKVLSAITADPIRS